MKIIISPYSSQLKDPKMINAKNYNAWPRLVMELSKTHELTQIGQGSEVKLQGVKNYCFDKNFSELLEIVKEHQVFISSDNFLQHFVHYYQLPIKGIVIWSLSDPRLFGYPENINILKDKKYLRKEQFLWWHSEPYNNDAFPGVGKILDEVKKLEKVRKEIPHTS